MDKNCKIGTSSNWVSCYLCRIRRVIESLATCATCIILVRINLQKQCFIKRFVFFWKMIIKKRFVTKAFLTFSQSKTSYGSFPKVGLYILLHLPYVTCLQSRRLCRVYFYTIQWWLCKNKPCMILILDYQVETAS